MKHQAPHLLKGMSLDVEDRKAIKSYSNTRKRKMRKLKNVELIDCNDCVSHAANFNEER